MSLRDEPYRLLFPVGLMLAWGGILHWLLHGVGLLPDYRPVFHAIAQIQGFMTCFATGFLFTAIPRRTGTRPAAAWEVTLGALLPVATSVAAWYGKLALSQVFWLALVAVLAQFVVRRFRSRTAGRRPPVGFIWIPLAFSMGVAGSILTATPGLMGPGWMRAHDLGRGLLLQGMFLGLVVGVGSMVLPLITHRAPPPDATSTPAARRARAGHLLAAAVLALSFWVEAAWSLQGSYLLRGSLVALLLVAAGVVRPPTVAGWHRWLVWISAWMIPAGYLLAALFPAEKKAGLHVVFIGGFALMVFSVGLHVILAHGGHERLVHGRPWQVPVFGGLLLAAALARALVDFDQMRFFSWLSLAAGLFLVASLAWASLAVPSIIRKPSG